MPFKKGNQFGKHSNHKPNFCKDTFTGSKWMQKSGETLRIRAEEIDKYRDLGWTPGRPALSEETRRKQSESGKKAIHPTRWKPGHKTWNNGEKMPESAGVAMSVAKLVKYGITETQILEARDKNMSWCSHHQQFEANVSFRMNKDGRRTSRCIECHNKHTPWYKEKFSEQRGLCAICQEIEARMDAMCVDHRHDCENLQHTRKHNPRIGCECSRGLLCSMCNPRLGYFEKFVENSTTISLCEDSWEYKALIYLNKYKK